MNKSRFELAGFARLLLIFCVCYFSASALSDTEAPIRFFSEKTQPYFWLDDEAKPTGISVDITRALAEQLGIEAKLEHVPWARAYNESINRPNIVLLSVLRTPERESVFQWIGLFQNVEGGLVSLKQKRFSNLSSLEHAKKYQVGTIRGYGVARYLQSKGFKEGLNLVLLAETETLWSMLYKDRLDFVVANNATYRYEIASLGLDPEKAHLKLPITELDAKLYIATGLLTEPEVVERLRDALQAIKEDGKFDQIIKRWQLEF